MDAQFKKAPVPTLESISVWRTVTLGALNGAAAYYEALNASGIKGFWLDAMMPFRRYEFPCAETMQEVDLVKVPDQMFNYYGELLTYGQICARARLIGLEFCPDELGPALRLVYTDQPRGVEVLVVTRPPGSERPCGYVLERGLLRIRGYFTNIDAWGYPYQFVFVKPRQK